MAEKKNAHHVIWYLIERCLSCGWASCPNIAVLKSLTFVALLSELGVALGNGDSNFPISLGVLDEQIYVSASAQSETSVVREILNKLVRIGPDGAGEVLLECVQDIDTTSLETLREFRFDKLLRAEATRRLILERQSFNVSFLLVPIGNVYIYYLKTPRCSDLLEAYVQNEKHQGGNLDFNMVGQKSFAPVSGKFDEHSPSLLFVAGVSKGFASWLKDYKAVFSSTRTRDAVWFRAAALDRGESEYRSILFGSKMPALPAVLEFKDSTQAYPLKPNEIDDNFAIDPVRFLNSVLDEIERQNGCPTQSTEYSVFDGKRRYKALLEGDESINALSRDESEANGIAIECSILLSSDPERLVEPSPGSESLEIPENDTNSHIEYIDKESELSIDSLGHGPQKRIDQSATYQSQNNLWMTDSHQLRVSVIVQLRKEGARLGSFSLKTPLGTVRGTTVDDSR